MRRSVLTATLVLSALLAIPACTQGEAVVDQTREVASASGGATLRVRGEATIQVDASGGAQVSHS